MVNTICLNCEKELTDKFCSSCGQKADTHRITFRNFIFHDLLHGIFHIERGMLFTAKQSLIRPGKAALEYISGKRKRYYNVFLLILITTGLMIFIRHMDQFFDTNSEVVVKKVFLNDASKRLDEILNQSKIFIFLFVPFGALNSFILFRRKKLNLSEHSIISGMILLGFLLIGTLGNILFHINLIMHLSEVFLSWLVTAFILIYVGFGYFKAFGSDYSNLGTAYRVILFFGLICLELLILFYILVGFVTNWKYGEIIIAPFG